MAKKGKSKSASGEDLKEEKIERISLKQLIQDERTHKIIGSIFLLFCLLLFVAFTSYLFTWDEDQSKVISEGSKLFWGTETEVNNMMGTFGAYISHFFIYKGFGIASYLFCSFLFVMGVNMFFSKKVFSIFRNLKYLIIGLPLISVTAAAIFGNNAFPWGGAVGDMCKDWMNMTIGKAGTFGVIAI